MQEDISVVCVQCVGDKVFHINECDYTYWCIFGVSGHVPPTFEIIQYKLATM